MQIQTRLVKIGESINEALAHAAQGPLVIHLEEGVYTEKVYINRPDVTLLGRGRDKTILTYADAAFMERDGRMMGTFATASLTIGAPFFHAENLTIANSFEYEAHRQRVAENPGKVKGLQAVALRTCEGAEHTTLTDCALLGWQDTLLLDCGSHRLQNCLIAGNIDFIFGGGMALFEECTILSKGPGYLVAPSTKGGKLGFVLYRCNVVREAGVADGSVFLGRPWHPGADPAVNSYCLLYECHLNAHIHPDGWTWMHAFPPGGGEVVFKAEDSRFFESSCHGPGALAKRENCGKPQALSTIEQVLEYMQLLEMR
nr:pectinesterase family protein [uncultured Sphaerochaeta sp.]